MTETALIADIGGTNARFALARWAGETPVIGQVQKYRAEEFAALRDVAGAYLESVDEKPTRACFAVAAPIDEDEIAFTNSPWRVRREDLKQALGLHELVIVNDFYALAASVGRLGADDFLSIKPGAPEPLSPILVAGPGTGFGQALIVPTKSGRKIIATEGGHVSFAPTTDEEYEIMKFIARDYDRVSVERVASGPGIVNIHRAVCARADASCAVLEADEITAAALKGDDPLAVKTVDLFCRILGGAVGDAVLATGALGGVVLGGGILPKIRDALLNGRFVDGFLDKGRRRDYVDNAPIRLIVQSNAALWGAAAVLNEHLNGN